MSESRTESQADGEGLAQVEKDLEEARSKAQSYLDLAQRTQADFVNYKRRVEQERSDFARSSRADIIQKFLSPVDDLQRAIQSLPPDVAGSEWAQGVQIVERKFLQVLESLGVKRVEAIGKQFNPWEEEAIANESSDEYEAGVVTTVVRPGYVIDGRILRPAQVVVSSGPRGSAEP